MADKMFISLAFLLVILARIGHCWTTEDLELFDLVESTPQTFYQVLGLDERATAGDIRKAYRKLSTQFHPDKSTDPNAEEVFRKIAAVAEVLRNDERRKTYDLILKTGLPDWRTPIYYYRQIRNMGLIEITIFLFLLTTLGQYLFAWASYWEKKYEIEEVVLAKVRRKAKNQRKSKNIKEDEEALVAEVMATLHRPSYQDLFPIRLFCFFLYLIKSSPSYVVLCCEYLRTRRAAKEESDDDDEEDEEVQTPRVRVRKVVKPSIPDYTGVPSFETNSKQITQPQPESYESAPKVLKWCLDSLTDDQISEFKKALKKFPNGTLQRWEKVASHLNCTVNEVVSMAKQMKNPQFCKGVAVSKQGLTGTEGENHGCELYEEKDAESGSWERGTVAEGTPVQADSSVETNGVERVWRQEEQQKLEVALKKFPKDTVARWERISEFVATKSKDECFERYKILVQQVKKKKERAL